ncbi:MAG: hypothetical protein EBZ36_02080 [Acidobacteria bacterium]|jgi:hypothetical protein|nr:hypothetical protein [Acidobacteriota bacterium]
MIYDRILFTAAAILNLLAALTIFFRPELMLERMRIADPAATLLVRTLFSSVATWGIAYGLIAFDPVRFRDLAWLGAISKTLFFLVQTAAFREGRLSRAAYLPALIDLLLAILFIEYLWRTPPPTQSR